MPEPYEPEPYEDTMKCIENLFPFSSTNIRYTEGVRQPEIPGLTLVFTTNGFTRSTTAEAYYAKSTVVHGSEFDRTIHLFSTLPISGTPSEADDDTLSVPASDVEKQDEIMRHHLLGHLYQICSDISATAMSDQSRQAWTSLLSDQNLILGHYLGHSSPASDGTQSHRVGWIERVSDDKGNETWIKRSATKNEAGEWTWSDDPDLQPPKSIKPFGEIDRLF